MSVTDTLTSHGSDPRAQLEDYWSSMLDATSNKPIEHEPVHRHKPSRTGWSPEDRMVRAANDPTYTVMHNGDSLDMHPDRKPKQGPQPALNTGGVTVPLGEDQFGHPIYATQEPFAVLALSGRDTRSTMDVNAAKRTTDMRHDVAKAQKKDAPEYVDAADMIYEMTRRVIHGPLLRAARALYKPTDFVITYLLVKPLTPVFQAGGAVVRGVNNAVKTSARFVKRTVVDPVMRPVTAAATWIGRQTSRVLDAVLVKAPNAVIDTMVRGAKRLYAWLDSIVRS